MGPKCWRLLHRVCPGRRQPEHEMAPRGCPLQQVRPRPSWAQAPGNARTSGHRMTPGRAPGGSRAALTGAEDIRACGSPSPHPAPACHSPPPPRWAPAAVQTAGCSFSVWPFPAQRPIQRLGGLGSLRGHCSCARSRISAEASSPRLCVVIVSHEAPRRSVTERGARLSGDDVTALEPCWVSQRCR